METNSSVLVVDADPIHARFLEKILTDEGMAAVVHPSSELAQEALKSQEISAVFVDLWVGKPRNLSFITWVRQCWQDVRIVAMSNIDSFTVELESLNRGADFFLGKPVSSESVRQVLSDKKKADSFSGFVEDVDIIEYLQFLLLTEKKVVLEVASRTGVKCRLYLSQGNVVHAVCGDLQGEEALYRCLSFRGGTFASRPWQEPEKVTIRRAREFLLVEAARARDEAREQIREQEGLPAVCYLGLPWPQRSRSRMGLVLERLKRLKNND